MSMFNSAKNLRNRCNSDSNNVSKLNINTLQSINSKILIKDKAISFFSKQSIQLKTMLNKYKNVRKENYENWKEMKQKNSENYNLLTSRKYNKDSLSKIKRSLSLDSLKIKISKNKCKNNNCIDKKTTLDFPNWILNRIENFKKKKNEKIEEKPNLFLAFLGKE